jgi:hypothetical protein
VETANETFSRSGMAGGTAFGFSLFVTGLEAPSNDATFFMVCFRAGWIN